MKKNKQEKIDQFLKRAMQDMEHEKAPENFASAIMAKIEQSKVQHVKTVYKPLIPKHIWWSLGIFVAALFIYLGFDVSWYTRGWLSTLKWNIIGNTNFLNSVTNFNLFDNTIYGIVGFILFMLVQIFYLKRFFAKRSVII